MSNVKHSGLISWYHHLLKSKNIVLCTRISISCVSIELSNIYAPQQCVHYLLYLLLHQVPRVCVSTVSCFSRLALHRHQRHCPNANAIRVPFPRMPHHLTLYALAVSSMPFSIRTCFSISGTTFRIYSDHH